jgi:hypothetical protein
VLFQCLSEKWQVFEQCYQNVCYIIQFSADSMLVFWEFTFPLLNRTSRGPFLHQTPSADMRSQGLLHVLLLSKMALLAQNHFQLLANCFPLYNWHIQKLLFQFTVTYFVTILFNLSCSDCRWVMDLTYPLIRSAGPSQCTGLVCNISSPMGSVCHLGLFEIMTLSSSGSGRA